MSFYDLGKKPLLGKLLKQVAQAKKVWLADISFGARTLNELKYWQDIIIPECQKILCKRE